VYPQVFESPKQRIACSWVTSLERRNLVMA
jgi:hypothetical protein